MWVPSPNSFEGCADGSCIQTTTEEVNMSNAEMEKQAANLKQMRVNMKKGALEADQKLQSISIEFAFVPSHLFVSPANDNCSTTDTMSSSKPRHTSARSFTMRLRASAPMWSISSSTSRLTWLNTKRGLKRLLWRTTRPHSYRPSLVY